MKSKTLALYLKSARQEAGFSQSDVASILGYRNSQFISNWERGVSAPPMKVLGKLVDLYRIDKQTVIEVILKDTRDYLEQEIKTKKNHY